MPSLKRTSALLRIALILCLIPLSKSSAAELLWLSDIHFDPFADPALVNKLAAEEPAGWASILAGGSGKFPGYGHDSSWPLFASAMKAAKNAQPNAAFTIVTGDLLAHHFREQFDAAASVHDDAAFRSFVRKSMEFVGLQLKQLSPGAPVVIGLGNNDDECGDYSIQPNGPFLQDTSKLVSDLAGVAHTDSFAASWIANGSYSLPHPTLRNHRIIVLNTTFFSPRYRDSCGQGSGDPGDGVLTWLASELADAKSHGKKVWLVYHIPPGVDAYATTHPKPPAVAGDVTLLWKDSYSSKFLSLMQQYSGVVGPNFAGHIHVDDFRLLGGLSKDSPFIVIGPSISPNTRQNPAFRLVTFDSHGSLRDQSTYYLQNPDQAGNGVEAVWKLEYNFRTEWRMHGLNAPNYRKLYQEINNSPQMATRWTLLYSASNPAQGSITPANFRQFSCAIGNLSVADYRACTSPPK